MVLMVLAKVVFLAMILGVFPLLYSYRVHRSVRVLLAFPSGNDLEELVQETGTWLSKELP
jgi:hypothetical protein